MCIPATGFSRVYKERSAKFIKGKKNCKPIFTLKIMVFLSSRDKVPYILMVMEREGL